MAEMKLTYFDGRGRAEASRMLFKLAGKSFVDNRIGGENWVAFKPTTPKGQLPVLEVDGKMMCESMAIHRFVARETGAYGSNNSEAADIDQILDTNNQVIDHLMTFKYRAKTEEAKAEAKEKVDSSLVALNKLVTSLKKGTFVLGNKPCLADVMLHCMVDACKTVMPDFDSAAAVPIVNGISEAFENVPAIAEWIKARPVSTF